jgi:divalent metal cation (Fe/Co/Zn/Cd) transporter
LITDKRLLEHGLWLEYVTLGWNVVGTGIVASAVLTNNSVALAGFGLDSLIGIFASLIVVWQLKGVNQKRERVALRLIGSAFFALAAYILIQSSLTLLKQLHPETSTIGLI